MRLHRFVIEVMIDTDDEPNDILADAVVELMDAGITVVSSEVVRLPQPPVS